VVDLGLLLAQMSVLAEVVLADLELAQD